jgi:surfeit locus 1 family protein
MTEEDQSWSPIRDDIDTGGGDSQASSESSELKDSTKQGTISRESLSQLPRLLISRRWWWTTLLVIAGMALLARLGFWQLDRLDQRRSTNAQLIQQLNSSPINLNSEQLPANLADLEDRQAVVSGSFDYSSQVMLTQQNWQGRPGVHFITPFLVDRLDVAILIDRGWIPAREAATGDLASYNDGSTADVEGVIRLSDSISAVPSGLNEPKEDWYRVDVAAIEAQMPYTLMPVYLQWLPEGPDLELPYRAEREIDLSEGSHLGYAIQWFLFATVLGVGYLALILQREKR